MAQLSLGLYQHYKGNVYQVIGLSRHSETLEELVVYQSLTETSAKDEAPGYVMC